MFSDFSFSDDTVGFLIEGDFNTELSLELHARILQKLKEYDRINLYLEDSNIENFSLDAVFEDIRFKVRNAERFNKVALVSDRRWIKLCAALEGVFTGMNIKSFSTDDRLKAMSWIAER